MTNNSTTIWQAEHKLRVRMHKLKWYYKKRTLINLFYSKAKSMQEDEADKWYKERHPEG